jgi:hypothetical protein
VLDAECHIPVYLLRENIYHVAPKRNPRGSIGRGIAAQDSHDLATALVVPTHDAQRDDLDDDEVYI